MSGERMAVIVCLIRTAAFKSGCAAFYGEPEWARVGAAAIDGRSAQARGGCMRRPLVDRRAAQQTLHQPLLLTSCRATTARSRSRAAGCAWRCPPPLTARPKASCWVLALAAVPGACSVFCAVHAAWDNWARAILLGLGTRRQHLVCVACAVHALLQVRIASGGGRMAVTMDRYEAS